MSDETPEFAPESTEHAERTEHARSTDQPELDPLVDTAVRLEHVTDEHPYGEPGEPIDANSPFLIGFQAALGVALAYAVVQAVDAIQQVLVLMLIALFVAVGLEPAVDFLVRRQWRRSAAVGAVMALILVFFGGFVAAAAPPLTRQATELVQQLPNDLERLRSNHAFRDFDDKYHVVTKLRQKAEAGPTLGVKTVGGVIGVGKKVLGVVFSTITVLTLLLYFLANFPDIKRMGLRLVPRSRRPRVGLIADEVLNRVGGYVLGNLATSVVAGVTALVFLEIAGVPYAVALAMLVAILDLIPLVGATIAAVVVTALAFFVSAPVGIATFVFFMVYQQVENFVIVPKIMKRTVDVSPVATIVAALIGASLLGVLGALLAIPVAAGISLVLKEVVFPKQDAL